MATPAESKVFKKAKAENFKSILKRQKEDESDPKFAISDSLQEYQSQLERSAGYTSQAKLNDAEIRQEIINFVIDYSVVELDSLKGMDFDDAKTQQQTTEKTIKEYEGLFKKGIISEEELAYIQETVGKTNVELKKVLGLSTKLSLSFRDFKKELKPLKLAKRIGLTNVPIIGKRIERAIESEERAEQRGISAKRQLRKKTAKADIKSGGSTSTGAGTKGGREDIAKDATAKSMGTGDFMPTDGGGADSEEQVEQERESDKQFDTSSGLLEKIYEESKLTNELLGGKKEDDKGFFEGIGSALLPLAALSGLGGIITSSITGLGSTLAGSMRSMLGLPPKAPKGPVGAKPKVLGTGTGTKAVTTTGTDKKDAKKTKVKTSTLVKNNVKKGAKIAGKVAGGAARVAGRVFLPLAAVMGIFDAAKGVAQAGDLLDKEEGEEITLRDKASSGFAGFLSGLTFGLVDKKKTAKFLAGDKDSPTTMESHDDLGLIENTAQKKIDKVNELKADKIDKITIGEGAAGNTIINNNVDNSSSTNKTEYGSTVIGTKNSDTTVGDYSNIG